MLFLERLASD